MLFYKILISFSILTFFLAPFSVLALGQMSQPILINNALRGNEYQELVTIVNNQNATATIQLSAEGQIAEWVKFYLPENQLEQTTTVNVNANQNKNVNVIFTIPKDTPNGTYTGTINVTHIYFINYYAEPTPEPEPEPEKQSGGGGGFTSRPEVNLALEYPSQKDVDYLYNEKIVVSNTGNIILTNGILTITLPENKLQFIDTDENTKTWTIPALEVDKDFSVDFAVSALDEGVADTDINLVFDQITKSAKMNEVLVLSGIGGGPKQYETAPPSEVTAPAAIIPAVPSGEVAGTGEQENIIIPSEENLPEIKGDQIFEIQNKKQPGCAWWEWMLIILLFVIINSSYSLIFNDN